jgi:hypothetical protein
VLTHGSPLTRHRRAAARWLERLGLQKQKLGLAELQLAAAALAVMPTHEDLAKLVLGTLSR